MKIMSVMPAAAASSTAYWIRGLSTTGSISLGLALVTGRKRLPRPATGNTALVIFSNAIDPSLGLLLPHSRPAWLPIPCKPGTSCSLPGAATHHRLQLFFVQHRNTELARAIEFAPRIGTRD